MSIVQALLKSKKKQPLWSVRPNQPVFHAIKLMSEKNIGAILVMENAQIKGIFTERDYARKIILTERSSKSTMVQDVMTSNVLYVTPEDSIDNCMALMTEKRVRHLPVLSNGTVLGIISIGDVVKSKIDNQALLIEELTRYVTNSYYTPAQENRLRATP